MVNQLSHTAIMRLLLSILFLLIFQNGKAQSDVNNLRIAVKKQIETGHYHRAITLLENHLEEVCRDSSVLFDVLIDLYVQEKRWSDVLNAYRFHHFSPDEDTTTLSIARFASGHSQEKISGSDTVQILFKRAIGGSPLIGVKVNGKKYRFWFDTGAGMTVLSSATAKKCGIVNAKIDNGIATASTGKKLQLHAGIIDSLEIGKMNIQNHVTIILNRRDLEWRLLGIRVFKIDGIIGWNLLQELDVTINNRTDSILLATTHESEIDATNFFWIGAPLIECIDENGDSSLFTIDTGAGNGGIYEPFLSHTAAKSAEEKKVLMSSAGGTKMIDSYKVPSVKLNVSDKQVVIIDAPLQPHGINSFFPADGVLGMRQFEGLIVHFNMQQGFFTLMDYRDVKEAF